jgi:NAD(P)-dependent dehydrogenase (short-subunit alcohol dehydrogenase family)
MVIVRCPEHEEGMRVTGLSGKVAVVTGGGAGIGRDIALDLARQGATIFIADISDAAPVAAEIAALGGKSSAHRVDLGNEADIGAFAQHVAAATDKVDILVNNAGLFTTLARGPFDQLDVQEWRKVLDVNVTGPFLMIRAVLSMLKQSGAGRVINITSATVFSAPPNMLHYVSSKGALTAMTRSLARELGSFGITVNAVAPGFTLSDGVLANQSESFSGQAERARAGRAIGRDQMPADIIGAVAFLAADNSGFITGQTIVVDGGTVMH